MVEEGLIQFFKRMFDIITPQNNLKEFQIKSVIGVAA